MIQLTLERTGLGIVSVYVYCMALILKKYCKVTLQSVLLKVQLQQVELISPIATFDYILAFLTLQK